MQETITITGMTCEHCADTIETVLNRLPGTRARVSYADRRAYLELNNDADLGPIINAIQAKGYDVLNDKPAVTDSADVQVAGDGENLQVAILGSGSGAFACAIRAAEAGARVTMVESADIIGGTCVNVGCVPSKIQIRAAQLAQLQRDNPFHALANRDPIIDRAALVDQQQARVLELRQAKYQSILDDNPAITLLRGRGRFIDAHILEIEHADAGETRLEADRILIATGAAPAVPAIPGLADTPYWTSTEALVGRSAPAHVVIIGSSVVAVEQAQALRRLGSRVTVLARSTLLAREDPELGTGLTEAFRAEGIEIREQTQPRAVRYTAGAFELEMDNGTIQADQLLVATGRAPNTQNMGLEAIGVATDDRGGIVVDKRLRTSVEHVYATGDCTNLPQFVYVAAAGGTRAAVNMAGGDAELDLRAMPAVIFTDPQVATVGLTEEQARKQGLDIEVRRLDLENVPRALANFDTHGFIKLVAETDNGRLVGAQILAAEAGEMIQTAALAVQQQMTVHELGNMLFPYLVYVEGIKLCAQTFSRDVAKLSCCAG